MPDYVYLLENRLSPDQRHALSQLRSVARDAANILFLTGDAVRDLTSGHAVRELEVAIHGNALKLRKAIEKTGGKLWGEDEASRSLYLCFPGTVRVNVVSTHSVQYPKPGKPVYQFASIQEDLRRRDFTVNSMALSLNEGSYGLLMDPLNGAADIESRILRLVSNYGFIDDPSLLIRAVRYRTRLGWEVDPRTQARYENAKSEGAIENLSQHGRSQELEQIGHEEDALNVLRAIEAEGWMKVLFPAWNSAKADEAKLNALHELAVALQLEGVHPDMSAAQMQLLTAKLAPKDLSALKRSLLRPGFVEEWNNLDSIANAFSKALLTKQNAKPSAMYKLFMSYDPEAVLWLGFTSKTKEIQERFNLFLKVWPEARQRIPYPLMQELRITPELSAFSEIVQGIFLELIDGKLNTPEEMRAHLEPHSPPAPPPQVTIKRARPRRAGARLKEEALEEEDSEESPAGEDEVETMGTEDEELDLSVLPKGELTAEVDDEGGSAEEDLEEEVSGGGSGKGAAKKDRASAKPPTGKPAPAAVTKPEAKAAPKAETKPVSGTKPTAGKPTTPALPAKAASAKGGHSAAQKSKPVSSATKPVAKPQSKATAKPVPKQAAKPAPKPVAKKTAKAAPAKAPKSKPKPSLASKAARPTRPKPSTAAAKKPSKPAKKR